MGLFTNSRTQVTNTTQNTADSYNTTMSKNDIVADSGNTSLNLSVAPGEQTGLTKYLPWIAVACLGLALVMILMQPKKPWET